MSTFKDWFDSQGFKHFGAGEFESYFAARRSGVKNSQPPRKLWQNILPTLRIVDELRASSASPAASSAPTARRTTTAPSAVPPTASTWSSTLWTSPSTA
jgi:hypothetical protein